MDGRRTGSEPPSRRAATNWVRFMGWASVAEQSQCAADAETVHSGRCRAGDSYAADGIGQWIRRSYCRGSGPASLSAAFSTTTTCTVLRRGSVNTGGRHQRRILLPVNRPANCTHYTARAPVVTQFSAAILPRGDDVLVSGAKTLR